MFLDAPVMVPFLNLKGPQVPKRSQPGIRVSILVNFSVGGIFRRSCDGGTRMCPRLPGTDPHTPPPKNPGVDFQRRNLEISGRRGGTDRQTDRQRTERRRRPPLPRRKDLSPWGRRSAPPHSNKSWREQCIEKRYLTQGLPILIFNRRQYITVRTGIHGGRKSYPSGTAMLKTKKRYTRQER